MEKLLLSIEEASEALALGRSLLYQKLQSGELQSVRVGRRRLVPVSAIREYIGKMLTDQEGEAQQP